MVDVSCRKRDSGWVVAMNGWKTLTDMVVNQGPSAAFSFPSVSFLTTAREHFPH